MTDATLRRNVAKALVLLERESITTTHIMNRRLVNVGEAQTRQVSGRFIGQDTYDEVTKLLGAE